MFVELHIILICIIFLNLLSTKYLEKKSKYLYNDNVILNDIGHSYIKNIPYNDYIINIIPVILVVSSYIFLNDKVNVIIPCMVVMLVLRMIANHLTILPKADKSCNGTGNFNGGCHDMMFSGHTAVVVFLCLFLHKQYPSFALHGVILSFLQMILLIATRSHYSIDIFIGMLVAFLIFSNRIMLKV